MLRDLNVYTGALVLVGFGGFLYHLISFSPTQWGEFLLITAVIVILSLFPIHLPSGALYSSGVIGFIYLLFRFGLTASGLALIVSCLVTFLRVSRWRPHEINWLRLFATLGMYVVSTSAAAATVWATAGLPLLVRVFLALITFETVNAALLAGILRSVGNRSHNFVRHMRELAIPIGIFTVAVTRLLAVEDTRSLIMESGLVLFFLYVILVFSRQHRAAAEAYRRSEEKYRLIAENTADMIVVVRPDGQVSYASPSHQTVLGIDIGEVERGGLFNQVHPDDHDGLRRLLCDIVHNRAPSQMQFRYRHRDREWVVVEAHASPVCSPDGWLDRVVLVIRDITERRETEELLRKSDKLAVVGQLAAGVAHEIRNPLTALKGFLQLLDAQVGPHSDYINIMRAELNRIELIIGEFLILAKPHASKFQLKRPQELLQSVVALFDTQAIMHNVQIETCADPALPCILCEENQIKQVFINVLKNSIEAMPHGGKITIELTADPQGVLIRFRDQGLGIPEENLSRLGEPFYTTKDTGTGLGLMISYRIIQAHNGRMSINSQIHRGTTVEILLPAAS